MARNFVAASSQRASVAAAAASAAPLTMVCWFRSSSNTANQAVMSLNAAASNDEFNIRVRGDVGGDPIAAIAKEGGTDAIVNSTAGYTVDVWAHACAVFASSTSRTIYLNGGNSATDTTSAAPASIARTAIGCLGRPTPVVFFSGDVAEAALYNAALTAAEAAMLALGVSPLLVRTGALVGYWPLLGRFSPEIDLRGGNGLTLTNTPVYADHPRIIYPTQAQIAAFSEAVAAGARPSLLLLGVGS